jgi:hypothetical protein
LASRVAWDLASRVACDRNFFFSPSPRTPPVGGLGGGHVPKLYEFSYNLGHVTTTPSRLPGLRAMSDPISHPPSGPCGRQPVHPLQECCRTVWCMSRPPPGPNSCPNRRWSKNHLGFWRLPAVFLRVFRSLPRLWPSPFLIPALGATWFPWQAGDSPICVKCSRRKKSIFSTPRARHGRLVGCNRLFRSRETRGYVAGSIGQKKNFSKFFSLSPEGGLAFRVACSAGGTWGSTVE